MSAEFLQQLYSEVLGREPDPAGFAHNLALLESGAISASEMANAFAGSQEAQTNAIPSSQEQSAAQNVVQQFGGGGGGGGGGGSPEQILNQAYQQVFGRAPDPAAQGWLGDIRAGLDLEGLKNILAGTPEARNRAIEGLPAAIAQNDPNNFVGKVSQLYISSLGRMPDPESLAANVSLLNQDPDAFGWLASSVVNSPEAQKYSERTGIDQTKVYEQATANYGLWTPKASAPMPGGLGGLLMKTGPVLPFALAAAAAMPAIFGGAGATGTTAGGAGAAGAGGAATGNAMLASLGLGAEASLPFTAAAGFSPELFTLAQTAATTGTALPFTAGYDLANTVQNFPGISPEQLASIMEINYGTNSLTALDAGRLAAQGYSPAAIDQVLAYSYTPAELAGTGITSMANTLPATSLLSGLSSLGNILSSPLGRLGAMGGLSLLSGGGATARQPVPQVAGGGTIVPRGMVDYTPIIDLLAPRQISRNSLLG